MSVILQLSLATSALPLLASFPTTTTTPSEHTPWGYALLNYVHRDLLLSAWLLRAAATFLPCQWTTLPLEHTCLPHHNGPQEMSLGVTGHCVWYSRYHLLPPENMMLFAIIYLFVSPLWTLVIGVLVCKSTKDLPPDVWKDPCGHAALLSSPSRCTTTALGIAYAQVCHIAVVVPSFVFRACIPYLPHSHSR